MSVRQHSSQSGPITAPATMAGSSTDAPSPERNGVRASEPGRRGRFRRKGTQRSLGELHRSRWQQLLLTALVLAAGMIFLVPIYWLFSGAVKPNEDIYSWPLSWFPSELLW